MQFVDTHSHLFLEEFDKDREETVKRAVSNGVDKILLPNVDSSTIGPMMALVKRFPAHCYPMMGLHPTSVDENYGQQLEVITSWLKKEKFYAIGEIGIDLYWDKTHLAAQQKAFVQQLELAKHYQLPVVIHTRNSFPEVFELLDKEIDHSLQGVFHSFTGNLEDAKKVIGYGFKIGVGGILTFKNSGLDKVLAGIDLKHMVLETDSPYLAPVPRRGKRNESAYIPHIGKKLAEIHNVSLEEVAAITTQNAYDLFQIKN